MNRKVVYAVLAVSAVLTLGLYLVLQARGSQGEAVSKEKSVVGLTEARPVVGYQAPDFTLTDLEGKTVRLSDLRGQPVYLNFWATWCPPCRKEMPDIQRVYTERGQAVRFFAINLTGTEKSTQAVRDFMSAGGYTMPVLLDEDNAVSDLYQVRAVPTSIFIDRDGVISFKYTGAVSRETLEAALEKIAP